MSALAAPARARAPSRLAQSPHPQPRRHARNTREITDALDTLFAELVEGVPGRASYVLNGGDAGLLASLDRLMAEAASAERPGGTSIAAHAEHLRYALGLMNRWAAGGNPFADADWAGAWRHPAVTDEAWAGRRAALREEAARWHATEGSSVP